jgi:hypothetical protein
MPTSSIADLHAQHPALYLAETDGGHRLEGRRGILGLLEPGTTGAELGVFTGLFSEVILEVVRPAVLHLVDPWWLAYGERYPDWGAYTDFGRLPTRVAHDAAAVRATTARGNCEVHIHVSTSADWLRGIPDDSLDWAYVDSTHYYEQTIEELTLLVAKIRPDGLVLGDDWRPDPGDPHHGVFRAVHEQVRAGTWDVVRADEHAQWAVRQAVRYRKGERYRQALRARVSRAAARLRRRG